MCFLLCELKNSHKLLPTNLNFIALNLINNIAASALDKRNTKKSNCCVGWKSRQRHRKRASKNFRILTRLQQRRVQNENKYNNNKNDGMTKRNSEISGYITCIFSLLSYQCVAFFIFFERKQQQRKSHNILKPIVNDNWKKNLKKINLATAVSNVWVLLDRKR